VSTPHSQKATGNEDLQNLLDLIASQRFCQWLQNISRVW